MSKKRRDTEDWRELGAYLLVAREALLKARTKAKNMYPQRTGPGKRIEKMLKEVDELRSELGSTWPGDETEHIPGPEPFYGRHFESVEAIHDALFRWVREEADRYRKEMEEEPEAARAFDEDTALLESGEAEMRPRRPEEA